MNYENLEIKVLEWAREKGILKKATSTSQAGKMLEEAVETLQAIIRRDKPEIIDGLGDTLVTLIILAELEGLNLVECLDSAYSVISRRTGKMIDGVFVKDGE